MKDARQIALGDALGEFTENTRAKAKEKIIPAEEKETEDKEKLKLEHEKHEKEMEVKENEVRPEIEAKFRDALESLRTKIQAIQKPDNKFPSRDALGELLEEIPVFAHLEKGAQEMFLDVLVNKKEFRSPDSQVFVAKGMEVLGFFINKAVLKKGGDLWLQERMEKRAAKNEGLQDEETPKETEDKIILNTRDIYPEQS